MSTIKIGIIGTGGISNQHIQAYMNDPETEVYALCDINEQRVRMMGEKYGILIKEAGEFSNIGCVVFDDFMNYRSVVAAHVKNGGEEDFGLDTLRDEGFKPYIKPFDGIIMWTWEEKDVPLIPEKFEIFKTLTPDNRRMFGCYLYNFGERKQATGAAVKWQLDWYREKILAGEAEGVVLHTNTMADLDYEAYDVACEWMDKYGDENIG